MKKLLKGFFTTALAVGFLAGCGKTSEKPSEKPSETPSEKVMHTVEFYEDNIGKFYMEVEVEHGAKVSKPADPKARKDYDFDGWWTTAAYEAKFDFETAIVADTTIYGKWEFNPDYVPDERIFQLVGDIKNEDVDFINWEVSGEEGVDWDVRSYLTKAEDSNLFSITIDIGYNGAIKVKIPGRPWDADVEFDFTHIREEDARDYLKTTGTRDVVIKAGGKYLIEVETTYSWMRVTRTGDATDNVAPDEEETTYPAWGIVGSMTDWSYNYVLEIDEGKEELGDEVYTLPAVFLEKGDEFKLRVGLGWTDGNHGTHEDNVVPEGKIKQGEKAGDNLVVLEDGYYSFFFDEEKLVIKETEFALRGDALTTGWDEDSAALALVGAPVVSEESAVLTYEGTYAFTAGSFKVKLADTGIDPFGGWSWSVGDGLKNFSITEGSHKVTFVLTINLETMQPTGVITTAAA